MNPLILSIINLVAKVGIDAAINIVQNLKNATTIDDAIVALHASRLKTWEDFKKEAEAALPVPTIPAPSPIPPGALPLGVLPSPAPLALPTEGPDDTVPAPTDLP